MVPRHQRGDKVKEVVGVLGALRLLRVLAMEKR
jgi:hypothetical protein